MKVNIGCGYDYLKGYLNVDSDRDSLADKFMRAYSLELEDASVSEIKAAQLIEHLGFFKAKYFLAECYRVLEPGGLLVIETPDIERTFEFFLKGGRSVREASLGWVYGSEFPGMEHRYCFPAELMAELLSGAGFDLKRTEPFECRPDRPALRFSAEKKSRRSAELEASLRRLLCAGGTAYFGNEYASSEIETLIKTALEPSVFESEAEVLELALYSPKLAEACFKLKGLSALSEKCAALAGSDFTGRRYSALSGQPLDAGQREAFGAALEEGRRELREALAGRMPSPGEPGPHPLFSFEMARVSSGRIFCSGLKAYERDDFASAAGYFSDSLKLFRDDPRAWLYFARSFEARGEYNVCEAAYEKALSLFAAGGPAGTGLIDAVKNELSVMRGKRA